MPKELLGRGADASVNSDPHGAKVNSALRQFMRLAYYLADFALGHFFIIRLTEPSLRPSRHRREGMV